MKRLAVIPARGGSKRLPRKNIMDFMGRPMIAWTIRAALESGMFDKVLVSTEDGEIAAISREVGAEVPFLRQAHFDDHATTSEATIAALKQAETHWEERYDVIVQLMANCPLRTAKDVRNALYHFEEGEHNFQISVFKYGWMNPWWAMRMNRDGTPAPLFPEALGARSQDLDTLYCPTGAIWIATRDSLLQAGTFHAPDRVLWPMPWEHAVDIDDADDLRLAIAVATMLGTSA